MLAGDITIDFDLHGTAPVTINLALAAAVHHPAEREPDHRRLQPAGQLGQHRQVSARTRCPGVRLRGKGIDAERGRPVHHERRQPGPRPGPVGPVHRGIIDRRPGRRSATASWATGSASTGTAGTTRRRTSGVLVNNGRDRHPHRQRRPGRPQRHRQLHQGHRPVRPGDQSHRHPGQPAVHRARWRGGGVLAWAWTTTSVPGTASSAAMAPGERNVIGPTRWEGIELSHGWDRDGHDNGPWRITRQPGHRQLDRVPHGRSLRHALPVGLDRRARPIRRACTSGTVRTTTSSRATTSRRTTTASACAPGRRTATRSSSNVIGISPRGESAPMDGWGIDLQQGLRDATLRGNVIRNAASGGVGPAERERDRGAHQPDDRGPHVADRPSGWHAGVMPARTTVLAAPRVVVSAGLRELARWCAARHVRARPSRSTVRAAPAGKAGTAERLPGPRHGRRRTALGMSRSGTSRLVIGSRPSRSGPTATPPRCRPGSPSGTSAAGR